MPEILYEDNHIIAVNKTQHDLVQGDATGDIALDRVIKEYIRDKYNKPGEVFLGVAHRLDRPVSGIVLFARTSKALTRLTTMFREGLIKKTYLAIVKHRPPDDSAELVHFLVRNAKQNKTYCYDAPKEAAKRSVLAYTLVSSSDNYHLLEIDLKTGRHHQIRAQLAHIGCAVKGDLKYGFPRSNPGGGISLHARSLKFVHPIRKEEIQLTAEPPEDEKLWKILIP